MQRSCDELQRLKRNLLIQLAALVAGPLLLLVYLAVDIGVVSDSIRRATTIERLAQAIKSDYKVFIDGVVDAVDSERLSAKALDALKAVDVDLKRLADELQNAEIAATSQRVEKHLKILRDDRSLKALTPLRSDITVINTTLASMVVTLGQQAREDVDGLTRTTRNLQYAIIILIVLTLAISVALAMYMMRRLTVPLEGAISVCERIADGALSAADSSNVGIDRDVGGLVRKIEIMRRKWVDVVTGLRGQSQMMGVATQCLDTQVRTLEGDANQQSAAAGRIAASVQEMTESIAKTAERAAEAHRMAQSAGTETTASVNDVRMISTEIEDVASIVREAAGHVSALGNKAGEIGGIVQVIKEISDQTNLLALNAAIEAARAGESGRGFAVVADEVRKLAERTGQSTLSIARVIDEMKEAILDIVRVIDRSVTRVEGSVQIGSAAVEHMETVKSLAQTVAGLIAEVDHELQAQRAATDRINSQAQHVSKLAHANVAAGREVAASAQTVGLSAQAITSDISFFKCETANVSVESVLF